MKSFLSGILFLHAVVFCAAVGGKFKHLSNAISPLDNKKNTFNTGKIICTEVSFANEGNNCIKVSENGQLSVLLATWEGNSELELGQEYCLLENKNCVTISGGGKVHIVPNTWDQTASGTTWCTGYNENSKEINCLKVDKDNTIKLLPETWVFPLYL